MVVNAPKEVVVAAAAAAAKHPQPVEVEAIPNHQELVVAEGDPIRVEANWATLLSLWLPQWLYLVPWWFQPLLPLPALVVSLPARP